MATLARSDFFYTYESRCEDPSTYLPRARIVGYKRKRLIYSSDQPSAGLYMVVRGRVKVSRLTSEGQEVVVDVYGNTRFFGESGLLALRHNEQAAALEDSMVMLWTVADIERLAAAQPPLAVALWQVLVRRSIDFAQRIESLALDTVDRRLARCLVRFADTLGAPREDGSIYIEALTHELLARYVATSRAIVSHDMSCFRQRGYLDYSRKGIAVRRDALQGWLRSHDLAPEGMHGE